MGNRGIGIEEGSEEGRKEEGVYRNIYIATRHKVPKTTSNIWVLSITKEYSVSRYLKLLSTL